MNTGTHPRHIPYAALAAAFLITLVSAYTRIQATTTLIDEQFLDGTFANGTNPAEIDTSWYFWNASAGGSAYTLITDNTAPLSGSVMRNPNGSAANTVAYAAFPGGAVTLARVGDFIRLELDGRAAGLTDSALFLGLFNANGTPIIGNEFGSADSRVLDDGGYSVRKYTGASRAVALRQVIAGGGTTTLGSLSGPFAADTDGSPHWLALQITRTALNKLEIAFSHDGVVNIVEDFSPVTFTFDEIRLQASQIDYRFDNIVVTRGNILNSVLDEQFLDGSFGNGTAVGENDTAWYFWNSSAAGTAYTLTTDNTAPLAGFVMRNPVGSASNTIAYGSLPGGGVELAQPGDSIRIELDVRLAGTLNRAFIVGLYDDNGTAISTNEFGVSSSSVADDGGYMLVKYSGASGASLQRQSPGGGSPATLSGLAGPYAMETDNIPHHVALVLTRLAEDRLAVTLEHDGVAATVEDSAPVTFWFNEIKLQGSQADFRFDNIRVSFNRDLPLLAWAECGPFWGRAGLGVIRFDAEGAMHPQPGDIEINSAHGGRGMVEWRAVSAESDGWLDFLDDTRFPRVVESSLAGDHDWAGMVNYLHTYLKASDTIPATAILRVQSSPYAPALWLNGEPVRPGATITLQPGWNRLMARVRSPATSAGDSLSTGWLFRASLAGVTTTIESGLTDPGRKVLVTDDGQAFRYLSSLARTDGDTPVFTLGTAASMTVNLDYTLKVALGTAANYQEPAIRRTKSFSGYPWVYSTDPALAGSGSPSWTTVPSGSWQAYAPARVRLRVIDDAGTEIAAQTFAVTFGGPEEGVITAPLSLSFAGFPLGHYVVFSEILDSSDRVLARDYEHAFSVIPGPVDVAADQKHRLLGAEGHWLLSNATRAPQRWRWLERVGIIAQQKLVASWGVWKASHDGAGHVTVDASATLDATLVEAATAGVVVYGDALEGFYDSVADNLKLPGIGGSLPAYGTAAWNDTFYNYGHGLADRYRSRISVWGGSNEIDIAADLGPRGAELYVAAARQIIAGLKAADPSALYISSSLVAQSHARDLIDAGYLAVPDIVDVHTHPNKAPEPGDASLYPSLGEGRSMLLAAGYTGPLIYGEISSPRALNNGGALGHAGDLVKQLAWGVNWRDAPVAPVIGLSYLVPYGGPDYNSAGLGFDSLHGDPLPIVNAANIASHLLDGRNKLPALTGLPSGVSHIRVTNADPGRPETVVIWRSAGEIVLTLPVTGSLITLTDIYGREQNLVPVAGKVTLKVSPLPQYLRGSF
ncbi:hypothetical protein OPIT5_29765 [Opitutaceae bacterium TAV5]|nr:hypothetical protein OPIT5_29765 [Opitutaceae bacterium TAV5]